MGNLTDPATLSALAGVLLALAQLVRLVVIAWRAPQLVDLEDGDTPPQTPPAPPPAAAAL